MDTLARSFHLDDELVRVLVDVQSGGDVYFAGDVATLKTRDSLRSIEEAVRVADDIRKNGGRPAVGLLGVPLEWASRYGRAPADLYRRWHGRLGRLPRSLHGEIATSPGSSLQPSPARIAAGSRFHFTTDVYPFAFSCGSWSQGDARYDLKAITDDRSAAGSNSPDPPPQRSGIFTDTFLDAAAMTELTDFSVHVPAPTKSGVAVARRFTSVPAPAVSPFPLRRAPRESSELCVVPAKLPRAAATAAMPSPSASARQ